MKKIGLEIGKKELKKKSERSSVAVEFKLNRNYFYRGKVEFDKQVCNLYELETKREYEFQSKKTVTIHREKRWISENGFILKYEMETDIIEPVNRVLSRQVSTYTYNPENLKIEAPIE